MGTALLRRTTRSLRLTEAGEAYLAVARRVVGELDAAEQQTATVMAEPQGLLVVTAPVTFGTLHIQPILDEFLRHYEKVQAKLLLLDRVVNLVEEGVDVAVRISHLPDSSLLAYPVGEVRRLVVASPSYLEQYGRPKQPADLAAHRCIVPTPLTPQEYWTFGRAKGSRATRVRIRPILSVNLVEAALRSAVSGLGITCALSYQVAEPLKSGALVRLMPAHEPPALPVHLVYAAAARTAKVRAFIEFAGKRLRRLLA